MTSDTGDPNLTLTDDAPDAGTDPGTGPGIDPDHDSEQLEANLRWLDTKTQGKRLKLRLGLDPAAEGQLKIVARQGKQSERLNFTRRQEVIKAQAKLESGRWLVRAKFTGEQGWASDKVRTRVKVD
jgi:hypothetical protein